VKYTIPNTATAAGVNGSYTYVYTYNVDGSPATVRLPALGDPGLGVETLTYGYNNLAQPTTLGTSLGGTYVTGTDYTSFSEVGAIHLRHNAGTIADIVRTYQTDTRRLSQIWTSKQTAPTTVADLRYSHDPAGNLTKASDLTSADTECFTTDYLRRLSQAWTPADGNCAPTPSAAMLGGPTAYWHTYTHDSVGNRTQMVEHATAAGDRTTTYTVPAGAHRLTGTSTTDTTGTTTGAYTYDTTGNTLTRPTASSDTQTLTWDPEGHLTTSQDTTGTTSYLYHVDGTRLIRKDPTGTTLYLPGQELRSTTSGGKKATRYYTHAGQTIATRTAGGGVTWLTGDHHGTTQISITAVGQTVATRRQTPYGQPRTGTGTWPTTMDKGFVGGTNDNTGLTHLGAREYDPKTGRFISVDPILDPTDPQQMHGYTYANNNPTTFTDPTGLIINKQCADGECPGGGYKPNQSPAAKFNPKPGFNIITGTHTIRNGNGPDGARTYPAARGTSPAAEREARRAAWNEKVRKQIDAITIIGAGSPDLDSPLYDCYYEKGLHNLDCALQYPEYQEAGVLAGLGNVARVCVKACGKKLGKYADELRSVDWKRVRRQLPKTVTAAAVGTVGNAACGAADANDFVKTTCFTLVNGTVGGITGALLKGVTEGVINGLTGTIGGGIGGYLWGRYGQPVFFPDKEIPFACPATMMCVPLGSGGPGRPFAPR
jgi:RHS repeat-associated protein